MPQLSTLFPVPLTYDANSVTGPPAVKSATLVCVTPVPLVHVPTLPSAVTMYFVFAESVGAKYLLLTEP